MKNYDLSKVKFGEYSRKSSEQEDRQVLSIESQIEQNLKLAKEYKVHIPKESIFRESKSAKKSRTRPVFEQMIRGIEKGVIDGIITWHPDRLSRNAGDAGRLIDLMDEGKLKYIITHQQIFSNTPSDKFFFNMLCIQAKMENDNKGENVMRGLVKKRRMGYPGGIAKVGYLNDKGEKGLRKILPDRERFGIVRNIFKLFLSEKYSVRQLHRLSVEKYNLTTTQRKNIGGVAIKLSSFYYMLKDPFYAGFFYGKDDNGDLVRYEVNKDVPRVITEKEHKKILSMIHRTGAERAWTYVEEFPYKRFMLCGNCGGSVTAEKKEQMICLNCKYKFSYKNKEDCPKCKIPLTKIKNSTKLRYIYYHCTRKRDRECPGGSVKESDIDIHLKKNFILPLAISPALKDWCLSSIVMLEREEGKLKGEVEEGHIKKIERLEKEKQKIRDGYQKGIFDEEDTSLRIAKTQEEIGHLRAKMGLKRGDKVITKSVDDKFEILVEVEEIIENGTYDEKVEALRLLGSNLTLKEKNLSSTKGILYEVIQKGLLQAKTKNPQFEPKNIIDISDRNEAFVDVCPILLRG